MPRKRWLTWPSSASARFKYRHASNRRGGSHDHCRQISQPARGSVIFDPVGVGSTPYRLEMAQKILSEVNVSVIRGNAGEYFRIDRSDRIDQRRGCAEEETAGLVENAAACAKSFKAVVAMTGKEDLITDGSTHYLVQNGHPLLMKVTGTGCLLSSVLGAFTAVGANHLQAVVTGVAAYGVAGELAALKQEKRPRIFQTACWINCIGLLTKICNQWPGCKR